MTAGGLPGIGALFRRAPGRAELGGLLELLTDAALLVDLRAMHIDLPNTALLQLTGCSRADLAQRPLTDLLPELTPAVLLQGLRARALTWRTPLKTRSGRTLRVQAVLHVLNAEAGYAVFLLDQKQGPAKEDGGMLAQRFQALPLLARTLLLPAPEEIVRHCLQAGQLFTGATSLAYYQIDLQRQYLCRKETWGLDAPFPSKLPVNEVGLLRLPTIWTPGARPLSALHTAALSGEISYVASIPVDSQSPFEALLVLADQINDPPEHLEAMLETLAAILQAAASHAGSLEAVEQKLLRQSQTMSASESIQDVVNDGLIFVSPSLKVTDLNAKAESLLGYTQDEVYGFPLQDILISSAPLDAALQALLAHPAPIDLGNLRLTRRDGQSLLAHLRLKPYMDHATLLRLAVVITDLSQIEQSDLRAQQLEQQAQLGELTAILAHEIRNPINNISAALQVMAMGLEPADPALDQIRAMQEDCERLEQLMRSVLSFAHARNYQMTPLDLGGFLHSVAGRWEARAASLGVELLLQLPETPISIHVDRVAFEQVFANLIGNALEAIPEGGGVIGIRAARSQESGEGHLVQIDLSDTGPGIPDEMLDRVFDPFFTTKSRGTGLGLAITQRIINAHNGQVSIKTFAGGTLFKIKLPIRPEPPPAM